MRVSFDEVDLMMALVDGLEKGSVYDVEAVVKCKGYNGKEVEGAVVKLPDGRAKAFSENMYEVVDDADKDSLPLIESLEAMEKFIIDYNEKEEN